MTKFKLNLKKISLIHILLGVIILLLLINLQPERVKLSNYYSFIFVKDNILEKMSDYYNKLKPQNVYIYADVEYDCNRSKPNPEYDQFQDRKRKACSVYQFSLIENSPWDKCVKNWEASAPREYIMYSAVCKKSAITQEVFTLFGKELFTVKRYSNSDQK